MRAPLRFPERHAGLLLLSALVALQAPLWLDPGYFSHDELQWAARATGASVVGLPFVSFTDVGAFQFRPLTFNLWLLFSHALFETPRLYHAVFVGLAAINAWLLASVLRRAGLRAAEACGAALIFGLSPYAVWVAGWLACLADLIWVGAGLVLLRILQELDREDHRHLLLAALAGLITTTLALLAKEAALVLPALLLFGAAWQRGSRVWLAAGLAAAVVAGIYLGLRLGVLLRPPADADVYAIDALAPPRRWLEYQVFPWAMGVREVGTVLAVSGRRQALFLMLLMALAWSLWRASPRHLLAWLGTGVLALGPVLVLPLSANQYGYGFIAASCGVIALARGQMPPRARAIVALLALLSLVHGLQVQRELHRVGRLQAVFTPTLLEAARAQPVGAIRLWSQETRDHPVYERLSHFIPDRNGVALDARVTMSEDPAEATHWVAADGRVRARSAVTP